jgi:flagellar basal body-associated protein FliL
MAEEEAAEKEVAEALAPPKGGGQGKSGKMLMLVISLGIALIFAGAGFGLSKLMGNTPAQAKAAPPPESAKDTAAAQEDAKPAKEEKSKGKEGKEEAKGKEGKGGKEEAKIEQGDFRYIDLDPIIVNLNEPRLARYVRAAITITLKKENEKTAKKVIEANMPKLKNWLTLNLAGRTLEDVRGTKNLNALARDIQDAFNQQLWPDQPPRIEGILFKEFAVQ